MRGLFVKVQPDGSNTEGRTNPNTDDNAIATDEELPTNMGQRHDITTNTNEGSDEITDRVPNTTHNEVEHSSLNSDDKQMANVVQEVEAKMIKERIEIVRVITTLFEKKQSKGSISGDNNYFAVDDSQRAVMMETG